MNHKLYATGILCLALSTSQTAIAQLAFSTKAYLDINNIKAATLVHGDIWHDPDTKKVSCEFPQGTGKHTNYQAALWMSGLDKGGMLHTSVNKYRNGIDFWPGPLGATGSVTYSVATDWARIWKVNASDIALYLSLPSHTLTNTPTSILEWPAKGNIYARGNAGAVLTITDDMAPFNDADLDGKYDPLKGDYPKIKGDQMLWWVFNDNGPAHTASATEPLGIEIKASAYAYSRGTKADNILFYEFDLRNTSVLTYSDFRVGLFSDVDLGFPFDDYIAFDSSRRMGITYNAKGIDAPNGLNSYGAHAPVTGLTMLEVPGDGLAGFQPLGTFTYFEPSTTSPIREPNNAMEYYRVLQGYNYNGDPMPFPGRYAYPVSDGAVECLDNNPAGDRRFVMAAPAFVLMANSSTKLAMAFVVSDTTGTTCGSPDIFGTITDLADTAWDIYFHPLPLSVTPDPKMAQSFRMYPNPAQSTLFVETGVSAGSYHERIRIYDATGKLVQAAIQKENTRYIISVGHLPKGIYSVVYSGEAYTKSQVFLKD